jgi:diguanylate cyclase (GGDEF)-like protein
LADKKKPCILLVESNLEVMGILRGQLERTDAYTIEAAYSAEPALSRQRALKPHVLIVGVAGLDGESLCQKARQNDALVSIGLVSPADDDSLDWRAEAAGADACLAGLLVGANLDSFVRTLVRMAEMRRRLAVLERIPSVEIEIEDEKPKGKAKVAKHMEPTPFGDASPGGFDFFRRLLLVEVHRSRRYKYPLAFLLASLDDWKKRAATLEPKDQAGFMGKVLRTVVKSVRDVDLCALYGNDRFVVFMPHTAPEGAKLVAGRILERIAAVEGELSNVTASVGLACYDGQGQVSYGALLREATEALKKSQTAGGNRVETSYKPKPRTRVSMG